MKNTKPLLSRIFRKSDLSLYYSAGHFNVHSTKLTLPTAEFGMWRYTLPTPVDASLQETAKAGFTPQPIDSKICLATAQPLI